MHKKFRWILLTVLLFLVVMSADRLFLLFTSNYLQGVSKNVFSALWLGVRYDLRELGILAVLMMMLSLIPVLNPFQSVMGRKIWTWLLSIVAVLLVVIYIIDTLHFDYLAQRLNASALNFIPEGNTSVMMVWQTYPVIKLVLLIAVLSTLIIFFIKKIIKNAAAQTNVVNKKGNIAAHIAVFLIAAFCIFGRADQYPLRWSDAFGLGDSRLSQLALNPIQSFFSSLSFRHVTYDEQASKKCYPMMADYFGLDSSAMQKPRFLRTIAGAAGNKPNVVLVICESFSAYKSSMWGNPLNTTPFFNTLCNEGIFFDQCFTPHFGTARGVWATVTGIPDVLLDKTASRDPMIVDQHSIINDFNGYEKDYFIGGSTSWANIKGVLEENIEHITVHEQGSYKAKKVDVWGISDKNLFLQANEVLRTKTGPFISVIQTSDNHRPYTIPDEDRAEVGVVDFPSDSLIKYGFQSNAELNAFRYTDYCFKKFIEAAKKEKYFSNTVFVFIGDHGIRGDARNMFSKAWTEYALTCFHVPLLFYAPGFLKPERHSMISSQVDVMPTIAGIAGIPYKNSTLGRDLLHLKDTTSNTAFMLDHDLKNIIAVHGDYFFQRNLQTNAEALVYLYSNEPVPKEQYNAVSDMMRSLTLGFYETSRYMLFNNRKAVRK